MRSFGISFLLAVSTLSLSACTPALQEKAAVAIVLDVSRSTSTWQYGLEQATVNWTNGIMQETDGPNELDISLFTMDAHAGSRNCIVSKQEITGGDGQNDVTRDENRQRGIELFQSSLQRFIKCEEAASVDIGTDLQMRNLKGFKRVLILTDGLLLNKANPKLNFGPAALDDLDSLKGQIDVFLSESTTDLNGVKVEVYGLGFQANLSSNQATNLQDAWVYMFEESGATVITVTSEMP